MKTLKAIYRYVDFLYFFLRQIPIHLKASGKIHTSILKRTTQQLHLLLSNSITANDYYKLNLYKDEIPIHNKKTFLGTYRMSRYYRYLNPTSYDILARDKVLFSLIADKFGLPTPRIVATFNPTHGMFAGRNLSTIDELQSFLKLPETQYLFIKPVSGMEGRQALAIGERIPQKDAWLTLPNKTPIELHEIISLLLSANGDDGRFIFQPLLQTHAFLSKLVPNVVSTIRIITCFDDQPSICGAVLRLGNGYTPTDNISSGGLAVPIHIESGTLDRAISWNNLIQETHDSHPFSGQPILNTQIPYWNETLTILNDAASKLRQLRCIGWDIAVTDVGPIIIEMNTLSGTTAIQAGRDTGLLATPLRGLLEPHDGICESALSLHSIKAKNRRPLFRKIRS